ncbi:hypothetical protein Tco_1438032 [Tanacetum coccineum]
METTVHQKEETFQVIIDVIKNSTCFKAFTLSADVPEIFMQQFWYTIKKVKDLESYKFLLSNKKCIIDAEIFRKILDICPRVEGEEFTEVQNNDATLTFLIDLSYKGSLHKYTSMENVDYPELIWEDFAFQIDHRKERKSRRETMPLPRFTKITPKKNIGKGSQRKKTAIVSQESVDVSDESEPEPAKKKTSSRKQEAADTMQALKESKKTSRRQPSNEGSSEGTSRIPGVPDESTFISAISSEGAGSEQESEYSEEDQHYDDEVDWIYSNEDDGKKDDADDNKSIDLEMTDDEETEDEFVHGDEQVNDDEDEEMLNAEVEDSGKGDAEISDVAKADAKKIE